MRPCLGHAGASGFDRFARLGELKIKGSGVKARDHLPVSDSVSLFNQERDQLTADLRNNLHLVRLHHPRRLPRNRDSTDGLLNVSAFDGLYVNLNRLRSQEFQRDHDRGDHEDDEDAAADFQSA